MKIALAQYRPGETVDGNLKLALEAGAKAASAGAELICYNQFFLGLIPPTYDARLIETLSQASKKNQLAAVTGNLVINSDSCEASSAYFDKNGNLAAFEPEKSAVCKMEPPTELFETALGPMLVLEELEAYDGAIDASIQEVKPRIIVMQVSAISLLELEAIKELAIDRSYNQAPLVLTVSMVGEFAGQNYLGCSMAVMQGQILGEAAAAEDDLLIVNVDPTHFIDYRALKEPVTIPELLQQKLVHESSFES